MNLQQSVRNLTAIDSSGNRYTFTVDGSDKIVVHTDEGIQTIGFVCEEVCSILKGATLHVAAGVKALEAAQGQSPKSYAKAILTNTSSFGAIGGTKDPRLPLLLEASKSASSDVRMAAFSALLDKRTTGLSQGKKKEILFALADSAVLATAKKDAHLQKEVGRIAQALRDDRPALTYLRKMTGEIARKMFLEGEVRFGDVLIVNVSDTAHRDVEAMRKSILLAKTPEDWDHIVVQKRRIAFIAEEHPKQELRWQAAETLAELKDTFRFKWDTECQSELAPERGALLLSERLAIGPNTVNSNSDKAIADIASACKGSRLLEKDPRIAILWKKGLEHQDPRVKLCTAALLLERQNTGVPKEARAAAVKAVARIAVIAELVTGRIGIKLDADYLRNNFMDRLGDKQLVQLYERTVLTSKRNLHLFLS
jgi:hypothetical protein